MARLFVSDLHLDASLPAAGSQFLEFLQNPAAHAEALYILGDLFEVWVGDDDTDPERQRICEGLARLTAGGVPCFVMHGNRDFLYAEGFCRRTGCQLLPDPVVADFDGERVLLTHGDVLCTDDRPYQELRTVVRDPRWQRHFMTQPFGARDLIMGQARAGSRRHTAATDVRIMDVSAGTVATAHQATRAGRIIHGHTHRPAVHQGVLDGRPVTRIVLGAWYEQGSYLWYEKGAYELRTLPRYGNGAAAHEHLAS
jgi:UDP-2,3-diacylglucosamine hydrolase